MNQILEKITKTLRLGKNNSNENEAQSAILAAQRLMAKYRITQEDINDFLNEGDSKSSEIIEEKAENDTNNEKWKRNLMIIIAKNFRCDVYFSGGKLVIVGEKDDILICKRIYLYAKQSILNSFKLFFKENYEQDAITNCFRNKCKRDFAYGFISGLSHKFEEQKQNSDLSLIVINRDVTEYLKNIKYTGIFHSKRSRVKNDYCYLQGEIQGHSLPDIDTKMKGENQE